MASRDGRFEAALEVQVLGIALGDAQRPAYLFEQGEPGGGGAQAVGGGVHAGGEQGGAVVGEDRAGAGGVLHRADDQRIKDQLDGAAQRTAVWTAERL